MVQTGGKFHALFQPIKVNKIEVKNRIVYVPCSTNFVEGEGYVGEELIAHYAARAKGGYGLIITPPVVPKLYDFEKVGRPVPGGVDAHPFLFKHDHRRGVSKLVEGVHAFGGLIIAQLTGAIHGRGRQSMPGFACYAASPVPMNIPKENLPAYAVKFHADKGWAPFMHELMRGPTPIESTIEELVYAEDNVAHSAEMLRELGFDGCEVHTAHGYGPFSFLSPRLNLRSDIYGGSFENRTRFLRNQIMKTRDKVGPDFPMGLRMSCSEHMPGGLSNDEVIEMCKMAEEWGVDYIDLSNGCYEALKWMLPEEDDQDLPEAEKVKRAVKIPVICPSIHDPEIGAKAIREGKIDMVGHGRQAFADPEWPNKVAEGRKFTKCIRCNVCWTRLEMGLPVRCEVNPNLGLEYQMPEYQRINAPHKKTYLMPTEVYHFPEVTTKWGY